MLAEKLLLNLLITIAPILIFSIFVEGKRKINKRILCGILQSLAAMLCMIFSYVNYGLHWDLRYVPLVIAILYGGPIAGGMVFVSLIGLRLIMGGQAIYFGLFNCVLTAGLSFLFLKRFWTFSSNKRVMVAVLINVFIILSCYLSLTIFRFIQGDALKLDFHLPDLILVGFIETIAIGLGAKLNEEFIERVRMKKEIMRSEKLNTLGELAASIAHEIRNPLTVVKGFLQLMQKEEKGKNYEYLTLVLNELGRAESIINDYLNFAKPQFRKVEEFLVNGVLMEALLLLEPFAAKQGVELHRNLEETNFTLHTDRNQLKQALINLIKNAIEATPDGGKVTINFTKKGGQAVILITDTGKGMTHEQLSRIGTLFYTTKDKGTGLGTSVSLRIIETMNGKITYKSQLGTGTEVTMILPGY